MKHILIVSQYYFPEQFRINDIAEEWVNRGYKVTVLTGIPNYPQGKFYTGYGWFKKRKEIINGVNIIRLPIVPRGKKSIMLALNYASFVVSGFIWKVFTRLKADLVFIYEVSPMTQALPGVWYAKKRRIPNYIYVMDLWPENVQYATGIRNQRILNLIGKMVDYIYKKVDKIFTSSKSFISEIEKRGIFREKILFWPQYAEDFYVPIDAKNVTVTEIPQDGILNITFAGNIGTAQGLQILPNVAEILKVKNIKVRFNIIGDGRYKETLQSEVKKYRVSEYFNFIDKIPAKLVPQYLGVSDVALISLAQNPIFDLTIPAKLQSSMACGKVLLVSANGEIQEIVKQSKSGLVSNSGDIEQLVLNIEKLVKLQPHDLLQLQKNSLDYYLENFEKGRLLDFIENEMLMKENKNEF